MIVKAEQPIQSLSELATEIDAGRLKMLVPSESKVFFELLMGSTNPEVKYVRTVPTYRIRTPCFRLYNEKRLPSA